MKGNLLFFYDKKSKKKSDQVSEKAFLNGREAAGKADKQIHAGKAECGTHNVKDAKIFCFFHSCYLRNQSGQYYFRIIIDFFTVITRERENQIVK